MAQTRMQSLFEAWLNIAIGFGINLIANLLVLPIFGFYPTIGDAFGMGLIFTVISIVRSYLLRRLFNRLHK